VLHEVGPDVPSAAEDQDAHGCAGSLGSGGTEESGRGGADEH
jgi:hypothetical protein